VVVTAAVASNGLFMHEAYKSYVSSTELVRGNLTALEIARDTVDPAFFLEEEFADTGFDHIDAGSYFSAVEAYGSPAYTIEELQGSSEAARFAADKVLLNALRVAPEPIPRSAVPDRGCFGVDGPKLFDVPTGGVAIVAGAKPVTDIQMRRFAGGEQLPVDFQTGVGAGEALAVPIPADLSSVPWKMRLEGGTATVCGLSEAD